MKLKHMVIKQETIANYNRMVAYGYGKDRKGHVLKGMTRSYLDLKEYFSLKTEKFLKKKKLLIQ